MSTPSILALTESYCKNLLINELSAQLVYHNLAHTEQVVSSAFEIGFAEGLNREDLELVQVAAWLHDVGFLHTQAGHEDFSQKIATDFLKFNGASEDYIQAVCACIEATRLPQTPAMHLAEILADADLAGLAKENFWERSLLLRQEWKNTKVAFYSEEEWCKNNLDFLQGHAYFTSYARRTLQPHKTSAYLRCLEELKKYKFKP